MHSLVERKNLPWQLFRLVIKERLNSYEAGLLLPLPIMLISCDLFYGSSVSVFSHNLATSVVRV